MCSETIQMLACWEKTSRKFTRGNRMSLTSFTRLENRYIYYTAMFPLRRNNVYNRFCYNVLYTCTIKLFVPPQMIIVTMILCKFRKERERLYKPGLLCIMLFRRVT